MKTVGIYLGKYLGNVPGEYHWDENTVQMGIGGSETWAYEVAKRISEQGYKVILYADPYFDHDVSNNFHMTNYNRYWYDILHMEYDYFIFSRFAGVDIISPYLKCNNIYVVCHDINIITPMNSQSQIGLGRVKKYCYLSDWHKDHLLKTYSNYGMDDSLLYKVSNGYSSQYYNDIILDTKENSMVWSSSLSRGFVDFYEHIFFPLLNKVSDLKLYVCNATKFTNDVDLMNKANLMPGVVVLDVLSKEKLAEYQKKSKIWIYPGAFPETFCITAVENANAGNVIISPLSYGLRTTLSKLDYLKKEQFKIITNENSQEEYDHYINFAYNILTDDELRIKYANACKDSCNEYNWDRSANEIIDLFNLPDPKELDLFKYHLKQFK